MTESVPVSVEDRHALGRAARKAVPRRSHAEWAPGADRPDPVSLIEEQNADRMQWLVPVRRGRMVVSPFTFYRGAARLMAADLALTPTSGIVVQACGDAHLSNFGAYGSPERQLVFDANDFDETLPGPWEWDVKRLATSFLIAGLDRTFDDATNRGLAAASVRAYREAIAGFAEMRVLDLWYDRLDADRVRQMDEWNGDKTARKNFDRFATKARSKDSPQALRKLAVEVDGKYQIKSLPPLLVPLRDLTEEGDPEQLHAAALETFYAFKETLSDDRRWLIERFTPVDVAVKVVGVGSVGTRCLIMLLQGRDREDPLFLQVKEATRSVLADHLPDSGYENEGRRVVEGQRLLQAVSDIFLGWTRGPEGRQFYIRQLRDWKGSFEVDLAKPQGLLRYAHLCGWTLARGHARSGDAVSIAAYLGNGAAFDESITEFAVSYAAQNAEDYEAFRAAIADGVLQADQEA